MLIRETAENTPITVYHTHGPLYAIYDGGCEVYLCRVQAAKLAEILRHIAETGEVPE